MPPNLDLRVNHIFTNFAPVSPTSVKEDGCGATKFLLDQVKGREEIAGLTRERTKRLLETLELVDQKGVDMSALQEIMDEEPPFYDIVKKYLSQWGISDRVSYQKVMFGITEGNDTANFYVNKGVRRLFPQNLMQFIIGKPLPGPTKNDAHEIGDKLYEPLDIQSLGGQLGELFARHGVRSREELSGIKYQEIIIDILKGFVLPTFPIILSAVDRDVQASKLRVNERKEILANLIWGE